MKFKLLLIGLLGIVLGLCFFLIRPSYVRFDIPIENIASVEIRFGDKKYLVKKITDQKKIEEIASFFESKDLRWQELLHVASAPESIIQFLDSNGDPVKVVRYGHGQCIAFEQDYSPIAWCNLNERQIYFLNNLCRQGAASDR